MLFLTRWLVPAGCWAKHRDCDPNEAITPAILASRAALRPIMLFLKDYPGDASSHACAKRRRLCSSGLPPCRSRHTVHDTTAWQTPRSVLILIREDNEMNIHLSKDEERFVHDAVRAGLYASEAAVVSDALNRLRQTMPKPARTAAKKAKSDRTTPKKSSPGLNSISI